MWDETLFLQDIMASKHLEYKLDENIMERKLV